MRPTVSACLVVAVSLWVPLAAQSPARPPSARIVDPTELSGPPKKAVDVSPGLRALAQAGDFKDFNSNDPKVVAAVVRKLTSLVQQYPNEPDLYFMRATLSCMSNGTKESILNDVSASLKLRASGRSIMDESPRDHYALRAKMEFDLKRYDEAMTDLDAAIRLDYSNASAVFNDGNVKPNQPTPTPCAWAQSDLNTLARLFPKDYRPPLYIGLYLLEFSKYSTDFDYQPVFKAFEHAAELNPASALPAYFNADPYVFGRIGGLMSMANATCLDTVVPRTKACLALDDKRRTGLRLLTKALAADSTFAPAYEMRALAHYHLREHRQAVRDYTSAVTLDPKAKVYNDRANAELELHDYLAAIADYTKAIAQGCESLCPAYENRANAYLKVKDYPHAITDVGYAIRNFLSGTIYGFNIDQFRRMYPEYDALSDDVLSEKLRVLFNPQMSHEVYAKQFLVDAKEMDDFVLPELFLKRGDAYADMGNMVRANREYDRVSAGFPKWAENAFTTINGKRVRQRQ